MPLNRPPLLFLSLLALGGCAKPLPTDGSPEAHRVAAWLTSAPPASSAPDPRLLPDAHLLLSDYGLPLTRDVVLRFGPSRTPGCVLARVERSRDGATATWACKPDLPLKKRQIDFALRGDRIRSARYEEADQWTADRGR